MSGYLKIGSYTPAKDDEPEVIEREHGYIFKD